MWDMAPRHCVIALLCFVTATLSRNVGSQLPGDTASYPKRTGTSTSRSSGYRVYRRPNPLLTCNLFVSANALLKERPAKWRLTVTDSNGIMWRAAVSSLSSTGRQLAHSYQTK